MQSLSSGWEAHSPSLRSCLPEGAHPVGSGALRPGASPARRAGAGRARGPRPRAGRRAAARGSTGARRRRGLGAAWPGLERPGALAGGPRGGRTPPTSCLLLRAGLGSGGAGCRSGAGVLALLSRSRPSSCESQSLSGQESSSAGIFLCRDGAYWANREGRRGRSGVGAAFSLRSSDFGGGGQGCGSSLRCPSARGGGGSVRICSRFQRRGFLL